MEFKLKTVFSSLHNRTLLNRNKVTIVTGSLPSEVACGESTHTVAPRICCFCILVAPLCKWKNWYFLPNFCILPQIKNFFQKSNCAHYPRIRHHLCAKFDFLGLRSPEYSFGEKTVTNPSRHPAYFAIHTEECCLG